ncbi:hypothetical protein [Actinomycetospora termitidis]|uniref:Uncharacterized protein n=1 Tax=Actinomycetospora termitidis TaxID=3053470 RepID=A0ABT7M9N1_9PSEU|nr:hypothetical protein [Actinomycetospora sp. Odt1-22]MDL5156512.1 hypothetical protein [Actinomycetospora sp. Odt1-22]
MAVSPGVEELLGEVAVLGETPTLLVACGFDGALAPLGDDRALQQSSEALNVLLALPGTTVAVISRRPADEVAELMFLSGAKGGLRMVAPDDVGALRRELGGVALVVDADPDSLTGLADTDLGVLVDEESDPDADPEQRVYRVTEAEDVVEVLEELVSARR